MFQIKKLSRRGTPGRCVKISVSVVKSILDLQILIQNVDLLIICNGVTNNGKQSADCTGYINQGTLIAVCRTVN